MDLIRSITINKDNVKEYADLESVGMRLIISTDVCLPKLKFICGDLGVSPTCILKADNLKFIGGSLELCFDSNLWADNLNYVGERLFLGSGATLSANKLKKIGGNVRLTRPCNVPDYILKLAVVDAL